MNITVYYPAPVDFTIAWPGMDAPMHLKLDQFVVSNAVSFDGERPENSATGEQRERAPVMAVASEAATVTDADGRKWTVPAGYYSVVEA